MSLHPPVSIPSEWYRRLRQRYLLLLPARARQPHPDRLRRPPCDEHVWVTGDADYDRNFTAQWNVQAMRYAQRVLSIGIPKTASGVIGCYKVRKLDSDL